MSEIEKYYKSKVLPQLQDKKTETKIYIELTKIISNAYTSNMASDESFCFKFSLPISVVNNFYQTLNLDPLEVGLVFKRDWGNVLTTMHKDSYYQILLLLMYYGIDQRKELFSKNALMVMLLKIWNGRRAHFFPQYCDKRIMKYVISNMLSNKHKTIGKFENPVSLLKDYFVPSILSKYAPEIRSDINKLKRLFEQSFARVRQIFGYNPRSNIQTGRSEYQGGILPLYMKAREQGLYISTTNTKPGEDEEVAGFEQYSSTHNRDEIVSKTTDFIVMNKINYPQNIITNINRKTNVSVKIIETILDSLSNHSYYDIIQDIIILVLSRCNISGQNDICKGSFSSDVQKNVISSKNNSETNKIQKLLDILLDKIFAAKLKIDFNNYSSVHKIKIRNVIIFGIEYNLFRVNCRGI